ncbi:hypothetical protein [Nocardia sp. CNY236]|uniref:hypothetical protein n=1 Tax=Nocardia sp. CNY236 TaxID=1169152 RepID=UPI00048F63B0|nr:hypothetical protein [Nocardia sp. CNY236]
MTLLIVGGTEAVSPMGMNKAGNQRAGDGLSTVVAPITDWTERSGYPDSVIGGSGLIARQAGQVMVYWGLNVTVSTTVTSTFELMLNDDSLQSLPIDDDGVVTSQLNSPLSLTPGDELWMRVTVPPTWTSTYVLDGPDTYIYFEAA